MMTNKSSVLAAGLLALMALPVAAQDQGQHTT